MTDGKREDAGDVGATGASQVTDPITMEASYDEFPRVEAAFRRLLDVTLDPRGPGSLFDLVAGLDLPAGSIVVDVGCGEGDDSIALKQRFKFEVHGIDLVPRHIELSSLAADDAGVTGRVRFALDQRRASRWPITAPT